MPVQTLETHKQAPWLSLPFKGTLRVIIFTKLSLNNVGV